MRPRPPRPPLTYTLFPFSTLFRSVNGIFYGFVLNVGNFVDTGKFWDTYDCPQDDYFFGPGAHMKTSIPGPANPLTDLLTNATAGILPLYRDTLQCNKRTLTDLGRYAIGKMMEKKNGRASGRGRVCRYV